MLLLLLLLLRAGAEHIVTTTDPSVGIELRSFLPEARMSSFIPCVDDWYPTKHLVGHRQAPEWQWWHRFDAREVQLLTRAT